MIHFTPLATHHFSLLHRWMQEPHVARWWGEGKAWSLQDIEEKYGSRIQGDMTFKEGKNPIASFVIQVGGDPAGFIQMYNACDFPRDACDIQSLWAEKKESLAALDFYP